MSFDSHALTDAFESTGWEPTAGEWETANWNNEHEPVSEKDFAKLAGNPPEISDYKKEW